MNKCKILLAAAAIAAISAVTAHAQINGLHVNDRVFNDFTTSDLTITHTNSVNQGFFGSSASIDETNYTDDGMGGNFANRHDIMLSRDGGASEFIFDIDQSWTFSTIVTLEAGSNAPAKEAGIRINSPITGDTHFIVKTNGEIVVFGGGAPFFPFHAGANPDYVPGTPILLGMTMTAFGDGNAAGKNTIQYFIDRMPFAAGGEASSPVFGWDNTEGGPVNYHMGVYAQAGVDLNNAQDFLSAGFNDIRFVPEPGTAVMSILGLLALAGFRRRRS